MSTPKVLLLAFILLSLVPSCFTQQEDDQENINIDDFPEQPLESESVQLRVQYLLDRLNDFRAKRNIQPLKLNNQLSLLAQKHAEDMVTRQFFDQTNPDGQSFFDRMQKAGIESAVGQNVLMTFTLNQAFVRLTQNSDLSQQVLNQKWEQIGIGIAINNNNDYNYIQIIYAARNLQLDLLNDEQQQQLRKSFLPMILQQNADFKQDRRLSKIIQNWISTNQSVSLLKYIMRKGPYAEIPQVSWFEYDYSKNLIKQEQQPQKFKCSNSVSNKFGFSIEQVGYKIKVWFACS